MELPQRKIRSAEAAHVEQAKREIRPVKAVSEAYALPPRGSVLDVDQATRIAMDNIELAAIEARTAKLQKEVDKQEARRAAEPEQSYKVEVPRELEAVHLAPPQLPPPVQRLIEAEASPVPEAAQPVPLVSLEAVVRSEARDASPSRMIGEYVVKHKIGEGALFEVYEGYHRGLSSEHVVALKVPREEAGEKGETAIDAERRILMKLDSPNIPKIYAAEPGVYVAEQLLRGKTLQVLISKAREKGEYLREESVFGGGIQMLRALAHVNERGIVHRDVKPANIMVESGSLVDEPEEGNRWALTDFNVSDDKKANVGSMYTGCSTSLTGLTDLYASPEQRQGKEADGRSDLYSLAVTLFEALTGELPLGSSVDPHDVNKKLSRDYTRFFNKALQRDPSKRFQTAEEMQKALTATSRGKYGGGTIFSIDYENKICVDVLHENTMRHGVAYSIGKHISDYSVSPDGQNMAVLLKESRDKEHFYQVDVLHLPSGINRTLVSMKLNSEEGKSLNLSEIQFTGTRVFVHGTGGWMECCEDGRYRQTSYHGDSKKVTTSPNNDYKVECLENMILITGAGSNSSEATRLERGYNPHWDPSDIGMRYVKIPEQPKPAEDRAVLQEVSPTPDVVPVPPTLKEAIRQVKEQSVSKRTWYNPFGW